MHTQHTRLQPQIENWKRQQQLSANAFNFETVLRGIQDVCERQADRLCECLHLVQRLWQVIATVSENAREYSDQNVRRYLEDACTYDDGRLRTLLGALISGSTVIERQPPQVMKTNTRFVTSLRMLIGSRLEIHRSPPTVTVSIINEAQAYALAQNQNYRTIGTSGEIQNNRGLMEYNPATRVLGLSFRNLALMKIKRAEKKDGETVTDEKFCLMFYFDVMSSQISISVQKLSLPVVVIVHGSQEADAWATVKWDNAFSQPQRLPFVAPEAVSWSQMAQTLSTEFLAAAGRELSRSSLYSLATKAFREPNLPPNCDDRQISRARFCRDALPGHAFSFWTWFHAAVKLTREHLRAQWKDGLIMGFIGRHATEAILLGSLPGTFLLRFSESELGGVSIAWVTECNGQMSVHMIHPFTAKDLEIRNISDRLCELSVSSLATVPCFCYSSVPSTIEQRKPKEF